MADIDPRRAFIVAYRKSFRLGLRSNLAVEMSLDLMLADVKEKRLLTDAQQREVDEFLKVDSSSVVNDKLKGKQERRILIEAEAETSHSFPVPQVNICNTTA